MSLLDRTKDIYELVKTGMTIELQEQLMGLREEALQIQEENLGFRKRVAELEDKLAIRSSVQFDGQIYWRTISDDRKEGPFCQRCFDIDSKLVHLQHKSYTIDGNTYSSWDCFECHRSYTA